MGTYFDFINRWAIMLGALLFLSPLAYSQTKKIHGTVIDNVSGKPLSGISVCLVQTRNCTTTDSEGKYYMEVPDTITISFSKFLGMRTKEVQAVSDSEYNILLINYKDLSVFDLTLEELLDIEVITAGKKSEKLRDIPASVVVISREEIETYGYNTLEEILQNVAGLYMVEQYKWSGMSGIGVRGFFAEGSFSNMVVMVNGSSALREGYINQYILSRIGLPIEAIDRIEIIRGPMSVMYGNGAFFGAINIITNDHSSKTTNVVSATYGSNNTSKLAVRIETNSENMSLAYNIGAYKTNGVDQLYTKMTSNPMLPNPDGGDWSYLESVGLSDDATTENQLSQDVKHFSVSGKYKRFKFDVGHTRAEKGLLWIAPTPNADGQNVYISGSDARFQYEQPLGKNIVLNGLLSYGSYTSMSRYNIQRTNGAGHSNISSANLFLEINGIYKPIEKFDITVGLIRENMLNASNDVDIPSFGVANSSWRVKLGDQIENYELYSQINYKPLKQLHLVAGARAMRFGEYTYQRIIDEGTATAKVFEKEFMVDHLHITGRLAALVKVSDNNIFKLLWGTAIMSPNMRQNVTRLDLSGEERSQLKAASMTTYEFSYNAAFSNKLYATFSLFRNDLDQLIESSGAPDANGDYIVVTQNTGMIQTNGVEISAKTKLAKSLDIQVSITYQESKNKKDGWENIDLGYSPNLLGYIKVAYKFDDKFSIAFNGNYVDEMETSWQQLDFDPEIGRRYGEKVDAYFCLNANLRADNIITKGLFANLSTTNLLNTDIYYATYPSNQWANKGFIGYGRRIMLTAGYKF